MHAVNIDAQLVKKGDAALKQVHEKMVELQNGCICCTLREDLLREVHSLALERRFDYLVIESTGIAEPLPVAETFTFSVPGFDALSDVARLDTMVTVVDVRNFPTDMASGESLKERHGAENVNDDDDRNVVDLLIDQVNAFSISLTFSILISIACICRSSLPM